MSTSETTGGGGHHDPLAPGLLGSVLNHWILVVAITVLAAGTTLVASRLATPRFDSTAVIHISEPGERTVFRPANSRDRERLLAQEADRVRLQDTTSRAAEALGAPWTTDTVRDAVTVRINTDANQLVITGRADTAVEARRLTRAVLAGYEAMKLDLEREATRNAIVRLERNVADLEEVVAAAGERLDALRLEVERQLDSLPPDERIRTATARLELLPEARSLQNERDGAEDAMAALRQEVRKLRIDTNLQAAGFDLVQPATLPAEPDFPQPLRDGALAAVVGFLLAVVVVWARAERDVPFVRGAEAATALGTAVLGTVPTRTAGTSERRGSYDRLLGGIQLALDRSDGKTVALTGVGEVDTGRVALLLAAAAARDGQNAVVVDARLRGGGITDDPSYADAAGWSDLQDEAAVGRVLEVATAPEERSAQFLLSPAGSHRGASARRFAGVLSRLIAQVRDPADLVVVESPSLLEAPSEVSAVARGVDGLIVVLGDRVPADVLPEVRWRAETLGVPVLGCVATQPARLVDRLRPHAGDRARAKRVPVGAVEVDAADVTSRVHVPAAASPEGRTP